MTSHDRTLSPSRGRHSMIDPMRPSTGTVEFSSSHDPYDAGRRYDYDDYPSDAGYASGYVYGTARSSSLEVHPVSSHRVRDPTTTAKKRTDYTGQSTRHRSNTTSAADHYTTPVRLAIPPSSRRSPSPIIHSGHRRTPSPLPSDSGRDVVPPSSQHNEHLSQVYRTDHASDKAHLDSQKSAEHRTGHDRHRVHSSAHSRRHPAYDELKMGDKIDGDDAYSYTTPREQFDQDYTVKTHHRRSRYSLDLPLIIVGDALGGGDADTSEIARPSRRRHRYAHDDYDKRDKCDNDAVQPASREAVNGSIASEMSNRSLLSPAEGYHHGRSQRDLRRRERSDDVDTSDDDLQFYRQEAPAIAHRRHSSTDTSKDNRDQSRHRSHRHHRQDASGGHHTDSPHRILEDGHASGTRQSPPVDHEDDTPRPVAVEPPAAPKEPEALPKEILKATREELLEERNPVRKEVAPLKDDHKQGIPPGARWTKIDRSLVSPEALLAGNERFEERSDYVIVFRVLSKGEIQAYAVKTQEILKATREESLEERNLVRKEVAPFKDDHKQGIPPGARWTKIDRSLVSPEALLAGKERFEERSDYVIVFRVLSKGEIQAYAVKTQEILKATREELLEERNPVRKEVAPLKDDHKQGIPPGARWTKIDRSLVSPEALLAGKKTQEIRDARHKEYLCDKSKSRDQIHRHGRGEDPSNDDEDESYDEPLKQLETPPAPNVQKLSLPELPHASSNSMPEAERHSIEKGAEVNANDQTGSVHDCHKDSELFARGIKTIQPQGNLPSANVFMDSPARNSEMEQAVPGMEFVHPSFPPRQPSPPRDSGSSSARSMATDITSPDLEDDSIDSGIHRTKNIDHILDPARYCSELDKLELKTAQTLGLEDGPYAILACLGDCLECFKNWKDALLYLQSQGFCGSIMSLFVEDQDQNEIASAFHISLDQIGFFISRLQSYMDPLNEQAIMELTKRWIRWILNVQDAAFADVDVMGSVRILCQILSIGLVSFSGSHVCRFDDNLWDQQMEEIPIGFKGYAFKPRKLACLEDFIGGPAWVISKDRYPAEILEHPRLPNRGYGPSPQGREAPQETQKASDGEPPMAWKVLQEQSQLRMKVSFTVQDLQELWGPVSLVGGTGDEGPVIRTERGFIVPVLREGQSSIYGVECHWTAEIPDHLSRESPDIRILLRNTSKIVIGTTTKPDIGLVVNEKCKSSMPLIQQQIACRLQYPGTCKSRYVSDGFDIQLVGGQYVTAGVMKKYKRIPRRTLKAMLVEDCPKPDTRLVPLLNLQVGLEVSACTGNAQRVTLWDALRLSQTGAQSTDNASCCAHEVGDKGCIGSCWTRWQSDDEIDSLGGIPRLNKRLSGAEARRVIINSILALEHSGVDSEGNLQVCWPFSHSHVNCPVSPSSPRDLHHWFPVVKDSRDTSSFAVFSQRCLEFPEQGLVRSCSAPCKEGHFKTVQTILATRILTVTEERSVSGLLQGAKFVVGEAHLTVTKTVRDQVAIIAAVSMNPLNPLRYRLRQILPDARAFEFKEHIRPDITTDLSVPVFAY